MYWAVIVPHFMRQYIKALTRVGLILESWIVFPIFFNEKFYWIFWTRLNEYFVEWIFWILFWIESFLGLIQWKNEFSKRIAQGYSWVPCAFGNVLHQFNEDHRRQLNIKVAFLSLTYNFCNIELDALKSKQINAFHFSFPESNCNSRKGESCHSFRIYSIQEWNGLVCKAK